MSAPRYWLPANIVTTSCPCLRCVSNGMLPKVSYEAVAPDQCKIIRAASLAEAQRSR